MMPFARYHVCAPGRPKGSIFDHVLEARQREVARVMDAGLGGYGCPG